MILYICLIPCGKQDLACKTCCMLPMDCVYELYLTITQTVDELGPAFLQAYRALFWNMASILRISANLEIHLLGR